jgi:hypothetical protein
VAKQIYRVKNWPTYNKDLIQRGSITFWMDQNISESWYCNVSVKKKGGQFQYSDSAIIMCLTIREVYKLTLRASQGFIQSILNMSYPGIKCPNYSIISRRTQKLEVEIPRLPVHGPIDVVIDSTGFKVYGEGEWKVRQHGYSKRRTWVKLHVAANPNTKEIISEAVTSNRITDSKAFPNIFKKIDRPMNAIAADGAYDKKDCYAVINARDTIPIIPPQKNAKVRNDPELSVRNFCIEYIRHLGNDEEARKKWKIESGYHMRSIAENAMFRLKQIFSPALKSRKPKTQETGLNVRIAALNKITFSGMPESYRVV